MALSGPHTKQPWYLTTSLSIWPAYCRKATDMSNKKAAPGEAAS
jgi:hypothetical protein